MKVFRLSPIAADDPSWRFSIEKSHLWTCAETARDARETVAKKTGFARLREPGAVSPWSDPRVTSCDEEPTMSYPDPGEVVREDGSEVAD
jgi:hypothetical protein